jgi:sulfate adenylyltransferase subunit 2
LSSEKRLQELEQITAHILREVFFTFQKVGMLWSIGKDSSVLLWIARKAFGGEVPFPVIHIDTNFKIPEMIEFRMKIAREWNLDLHVGQNIQALEAKQTFPDGALTRIQCCQMLKTTPLLNTISGKWPHKVLNHSTGLLELHSEQTPFDAIFVGLRGDEEGSRSKERYVSPRDAAGLWDISSQPAELWGVFQDCVPESVGENKIPLKGSVRAHPILDWTELDIWEYIEREKIPLTNLYYDQGDGTRYRSLGCGCCTEKILSPSKNSSEIVVELQGKLKNIAERSGRAQDKEGQGGLETLRRSGYM